MHYVLDHCPEVLSAVFIQAPAEKAMREAVAWRRELGYAGEAVSEKRQTIAQSLTWLEPRVFTPTRCVFIALSESWCLLLDNHLHQDAPQAEPFVLCERLQARTYTAGIHPERGYVFGSYAPDANGAKQRLVEVIKEDAWKFGELGEPLPFEQVNAYQLRRVRERLTAEMVRSYMDAVGVPQVHSAVNSYCVSYGQQEPRDSAEVANSLRTMWEQVKKRLSPP